MTTPVLEADGLVIELRAGDTQVVRPVNEVSLTLQAGRTLGLVGESGSGKSLLALSLLRLLPPAGRIAAGRLMFRGTDLVALPESEMRAVRGNVLSIVFQEPMTALNPVLTVGEQVAETVRLHAKASRKDARARTVELFRLVGIPSPVERVDAYPHQLSGGMRQRVLIAMALACRPAVLVADEPTTALDVTIQAQILELLRGLQRELGMAILLITHDLGVVAQACDDVAVMYAGRIVEQAPVQELFARPRHPYTAALLRSIPSLATAGPQRLHEIPGRVPSLSALPPGCAFGDRCDAVQPRCREVEPPDVVHRNDDDARRVRCHFPLGATP